MKRLVSISITLFALLSVSGCGCFQFGTWDDDPHNWQRSFMTKAPPEVTIVHSRYWSSAHWSHEYICHFEIIAPDSVKAQLAAKYNLEEVTGAEAENDKRNSCRNAPEWFAPKVEAAYEVWIDKSDHWNHFRMLVDRDTKHIFLTDCLL